MALVRGLYFDSSNFKFIGHWLLLTVAYGRCLRAVDLLSFYRLYKD